MSQEAERTKDRPVRLHQMHHSSMGPVNVLTKLLGQ